MLSYHITHYCNHLQHNAIWTTKDINVLHKAVVTHTGKSSNGGVSWSSVAVDLQNKFTWQQARGKWNSIRVIEIDEQEDSNNQENQASDPEVKEKCGTTVHKMQEDLRKLHDGNLLLQEQMKAQNSYVLQINAENKSLKKNARKSDPIVEKSHKKHKRQEGATEEEVVTEVKRKRKKSKGRKKDRMDKTDTKEVPEEGKHHDNKQSCGVGYNMFDLLLSNTIDTVQSDCDKIDKVATLEKQLTKYRMLMAAQCYK
jgi:hypothetical protein